MVFANTITDTKNQKSLIFDNTRSKNEDRLYTFSNIKELLSSLKREEKLITEMFSKRKSLAYKVNYALELVDFDENRINYLIEHGVIRENEDTLELDDLYLEFFEQILEVNEAINLSYVNENIQNIKENINYYLNEDSLNRKYSYLRFIKKTFRKIGLVTIRNVVDLRRNIENTFKNEPNYKNKKAKLENFDEKRITIKELIENTLILIDNDEHTFFKTATDGELNTVIIELKNNLRECSHNLIEIEKQIIDFLNQIKHHGKLIEKIRKLKYLKEQFSIESDTNIRQVLSENKAIAFEQRVIEPLKLSLSYLQTDEEAFSSIKSIAEKFKNRDKLLPQIADNISLDLLENNINEEVLINLEELRNSFVATSNDLFNFVMSYNFDKNVDFHERVTIFCQVASQFENEFEIKDEVQTTDGIEYAVVYPK